MRLSHRDFDALQRTILDLYEYRDVESFRQAVPGIFLKIIPADYFGLTGYNLEASGGRARLADWFESSRRINPTIIERIEHFVITHPFTSYFVRTGDQTALKLSDFFSQEQLMNSELYWDAYRPWEIEHALSASVESSRAAVAGISLAGRGRDFTERDRLILNLLRPHFNQAQRNAELATRSRVDQRPLEDYGLSPREAEVARWIANGKTNPEIALILGARSVRTIEKHVERILEKLGVENRTAAAVMIAQSS